MGVKVQASYGAVIMYFIYMHVHGGCISGGGNNSLNWILSLLKLRL